MPKQEMGLMGYIGELVVEQWIRSEYPYCRAGGGEGLKNA